MFLRASFGASRGLRLSVLALVTVVTVVALASDPADARRRRRHHHVVRYNPPYAALVVDLNNGKVLHATNADARRHPASLTKVMTLYLLFEQLEAGKLKLNTPLQVSAHAASQAPSKLGLEPGSTIEVGDAIKAIVTKSANDVAVVVAEAIAGSESSFAKLMTQKAHAIGMVHTTYVNASGLPDDDQLTTARDQATLGRVIQERFPRYYRYFSTASFFYRGHAMRNHNHLLGRVDGVDGIKTGYIRDSGFNIITSVRRGKRHMIAVVFGGRTARWRDARVRELIESNIRRASVDLVAPAVVQRIDAKPRPRPDLAKEKPARAVRVADVGTTTLPAVTHPIVGSHDPIQPIPVKTVTYKHRKPRGAVEPIGLTAPNGALLSPTPITSAPIPPAPIAQAPAPAAKPAKAEVPDVKATASTRVAALEPRADFPDEQPETSHGDWLIQVGAFEDKNEAKERLRDALTTAKSMLTAAKPFTMKFVKGRTVYYRARFAGLDQDEAEAVCRYLKRKDFACMTLKDD